MAERPEDGEDRLRRAPRDEELPRRPRRGDDDSVDDRPRISRRWRKVHGFSFCDSIDMSYVSQVLIGVLLGIMLAIVARFAHLDVLYLPSCLFWIWGCAAYAKNKGYSEWLGLLGLFALCGFVVLVSLPNRGNL
jgi:uncharacterized membrane protein